MISFNQVSKQYRDGHKALKEVSFNIDAGEMVFIEGHSGAGKSTLFKLIALLEKPTHGEITIDGDNLSLIKPRSIAQLRREIGVIFQDHKLLLNRSVFDNVALPLMVTGMAQENIHKRVRAALNKVDLSNKENALPITLSGGEQQRVGIARAVINSPSILLADEPTGNLDQSLSDEIMNLFVDFNRGGVTVLIATHDQHHIQRLSKRTLHLNHGRLIADNAVEQQTATPTF